MSTPTPPSRRLSRSWHDPSAIPQDGLSDTSPADHRAHDARDDTEVLVEHAAAETPTARLHRCGPKALSSIELLTLTLGKHARTSPQKLARKLLDRFGSLRAMSVVSARELERTHGLGPATAERLAATLALGARAHQEQLRPGVLLRTSGEIFNAFHRHLRDKRQEVFIVVMLDGKNRVITHETITRGILTASLVHPREVFGAAIRVAAAGIVIVHNHPSGDPEPSPEDHEVTRRLEAVGELIGIHVLDHVVVGEDTYVSFLERGLLQN